MNESWDQSKVFDALVNRGEKIKESSQDRYVKLYHPQPQNAALLYQGSPKAPVHINHRQWSRESWEEIKGCLPYLIWVGRDRGKQTIFDKYKVDDWDAFAKALGLPLGHKIGNLFAAGLTGNGPAMRK